MIRTINFNIKTVDFRAMMDMLMIGSFNKKPDETICSKIEPVYEITNLGFEGMQVKSFFRPRLKKRSGKC